MKLENKEFSILEDLELGIMENFEVLCLTF